MERGHKESDDFVFIRGLGGYIGERNSVALLELAVVEGLDYVRSVLVHIKERTLLLLGQQRLQLLLPLAHSLGK